MISLKLNTFQKILLSLIASVLSLSLLLNIVKITTPMNHINRKGYGLFSMLKYTLIDAPFQAVLEFGSSFSNLWTVHQENQQLRKQIANIASMQASIKEAQNQISELKSMLDLKTINNEYYYVSATVLSRSPETYNNLLTLDVGTKDGVLDNQAVITASGLIGKIINVSEHTSVVKLLTTSDGKNKVSVKILINDSNTADAILEKYDANEKAYYVVLLNANTTITEGMQVVTSGMGGVFPSGLLVGTVAKIEEIPNAISMKIFVKPSADFNDINYVKVVTKGSRQ